MTRKPVFSIPSKPMSRRALLRGAGGVALGLPFLDVMRPRLAHAQTGIPKRFVTVFSANGSIMDQWQPSGSETNFTLSPILSPLQAHKEDLLILRGLNNEASYVREMNAHDFSMSTMLTGNFLRGGPSGLGNFGHILDGTVDGPSIDQEIARAIGSETKLPSLELGVQSTTTILDPMVLRMCFRGAPGNTRSLPPEDDPRKVFERLFMDAGASATSLENLKIQRKSILDFVKNDFQRLQSKVSSDDRKKLDRHFTTVRELELSLDKLGGDGLSCSIPDSPPDVNLNAYDCVQDERPARCFGDFQELGKAQMDMLVLALACDLTRVVSLQWSTAESTVFFRWLNVATEHHLMSHNPNGYRDDLIKINTWYAQQFAYLLDALKGQEDADGPLLDSSIVLWANELSNGEIHNRRDLGWLLAGKGNGALNTGRNLRVPNNTTTNQLFASLQTMYGLPTNSFGAPQYSGTLSGLG